MTSIHSIFNPNCDTCRKDAHLAIDFAFDHRTVEHLQLNSVGREGGCTHDRPATVVAKTVALASVDAGEPMLPGIGPTTPNGFE